MEQEASTATPIAASAANGSKPNKMYIATPIFCITDGSVAQKIVGVMQGAEIELGPTHTMQDLEREIGKQYKLLQNTIQTPILYRSVVVSQFDPTRGTLEDLGLRLAR